MYETGNEGVTIITRKVPDGREGNQKQADEDENEREAHQYHHRPVVCMN